jgi:hypothetical protein
MQSWCYLAGGKMVSKGENRNPGKKASGSSHHSAQENCAKKPEQEVSLITSLILQDKERRLERLKNELDLKHVLWS